LFGRRRAQQVEIRRITNQSEPLEVHYSRLADDPRTSPDYAEIGRRMLELLRLLPGIDGPPVWAMTSHADLLLVSSDDYPQQRLVAIRGNGFGEVFSFRIEFQMPASEAPWPGARVLLGTHNTAEACAMVAHGLRQATGANYSVPTPAEPHAAADRGGIGGS
jgi:hypothetical protein